MNGLLIIDKPAGITSARVVDVVKRLLPRGTKVGHAGTLDPFATGVLVLLIGKSTKLCDELMAQPKSYLAMIKLGATTRTDDPESPEISSPNARAVQLHLVQSALEHFRGTIEQRPPAYSAIKLAGRRAYDLARRGLHVELKPRPVIIHRIEIVNYGFPMLELAIDCGRGTYIRSIARDLGEKLGVGGYLTQLRRTRVGDVSQDQAVRLVDLSRATIVGVLRSRS